MSQRAVASDVAAGLRDRITALNAENLALRRHRDELLALCLKSQHALKADEGPLLRALQGATKHAFSRSTSKK